MEAQFIFLEGLLGLSGLTPFLPGFEGYSGQAGFLSQYPLVIWTAWLKPDRYVQCAKSTIGKNPQGMEEQRFRQQGACLLYISWPCFGLKVLPCAAVVPAISFHFYTEVSRFMQDVN